MATKTGVGRGKKRGEPSPSDTNAGPAGVAPVPEERRAGQPDPDIRIHRRFNPEQLAAGLPPLTEGEVFLGAVVDVETTGLNAETCEIIEVGILTFGYDTTDRIVTVGDSYSGLQEPSKPLDPKITEITGLKDEDLKGRKIDWGRVNELTQNVRLFVAHNANLDRQFVEEHSPVEPFVKRAWACSYNELDWKALFPEVTAGALGSVLAGTRREFYEAHRALDDCKAVLRVISAPLAALGPNALERQAFSELLVSARATTRRIWARGAPFSMKDELKLDRQYRWHEGQRTWYFDTQDPEEVARELAWLRERGVSSKDGLVTYFTAKDRWSKRV